MKEMICISKGNRKVGKIPSVSLPPIVTCPYKCKGCYAAKLCRIYPNVRESYERNYSVYQNDPDLYWSEVGKALSTARFFRFHVSGDIPDYRYLEKMVETMRNNPNCTALCFTKRYGFVNRWIAENGDLPENLKLIFSIWPGFPYENPYDLPTAHVRFRNGITTAPDNAIECYGNCTDCVVAGCGCWKLGKGEAVAFKQH